MKKLLTLLLLLVVSLANAQKAEKSNAITNYPSVNFYSLLENPIPKEYVYIDNFNQFIDVPPVPNLLMFPGMDMINANNLTGQWMGTSTTSTFQFLNTEFESRQVYDLNGVLRQSSVTIPIKKQRFTFFPAH